ncbi:type IV pilus modification PilV family protein [Bacillus timonensis]|uniref:type IV pilus modification PilV family protein n=1 Tax=Bacillus timonensis TaxID=1033734 RepID=UPI0002890EEF|nr:prepilin-type N-terminal cleavage/methylation domain-containing protein [Bacillus timonensis]
MKKSEQGFTLLEVLAAMTIIGIVLLVFLNAVGFTTFNIRNSDNKTEAIRIAEQELNQTLNDISANPRDFEIKSTTSQAENFPVTVFQTEINNPTYSLPDDSNKYVFLQGIAVFTGTDNISKKGLITVAVKWRE